MHGCALSYLGQLGNSDSPGFVVFILFPIELLPLMLFFEHHEQEQLLYLPSKQLHELIWTVKSVQRDQKMS